MSVLEMVMRDDSFHLDTEVCHQSVSIAGALLVMGLTESTRDIVWIWPWSCAVSGEMLGPVHSTTTKEWWKMFARLTGSVVIVP